MSLNSLGTASASSVSNQVCQVNKTSSDTSGTTRVDRGAPPPPPPPDGGGLIDAIAKALQSLGVGENSSSVTSNNTTDGSVSNDITADQADSNSANAAQALGNFLQELLGALHQQKSAQQAPTAQSPTSTSSEVGALKEFRGPGRLQDDLQSLMSQLQSTDSDTVTVDTTELSSSFAKLLQALGVNQANGNSEENKTKLSDFLQTLMSNLLSDSQRGNVINVSA